VIAAINPVAYFA